MIAKSPVANNGQNQASAQAKVATMALVPISPTHIKVWHVPSSILMPGGEDTSIKLDAQTSQQMKIAPWQGTLQLTI